MFRFSITYSILTFVFYECLCFNIIDINNPIIYLDQSKYLNVAPSNKSSFFGLSVILYPGDNINLPWIQIGAPRSNSPNVKFENPGVIFRCNIFAPCRYIEVDTEGVNSSHSRYNYVNKLDDAWIGAVMDINLKFNRTVVCAPRWINIKNSDYRMLGSCYWSHINSNEYFKKIPLLNSRRYTYVDPNGGSNVYDYGQGESGFSAHMPESKNELLLGAPGVYNWKGTNILYTDQTIIDEEPPYSRFTMLSKREVITRQPLNIEEFNNQNIAEARTTYEIGPYSLSGYAVTSGCFFSNGTDCLYYVTGAPKSSIYFGKVVIFKFRKTEKPLLVKTSKEGSQFGEYFGASLSAGDINDDGLDDLFVGAPFHKTSKYNEGRMYLFLGSSEGRLKEPSHGKFIDGSTAHGQFGTTITYLGTLNTDMHSKGSKYVAVSAPYEESSGVVYIFRGRSTGLEATPVQRIVGSSFSPKIKGFGISISKPVDIDGNGYQDIAVGAYKSGHVVLLRSRPVVKLRTYFQPGPTKITKDEKEFNITICHEYSCFRGSHYIRMSRSIVVDEVYKRAYPTSSNNDSNQITVFMGQPNCENVRITLGKVHNLFKPLVIKVTHSLIDESKPGNKLIISDKLEGMDEFCQNCGIFDDLSPGTTVEKKVPFVLDCGDDDICRSILEFQTQLHGVGVTGNTYILGATNVTKINVHIKNKGENAYSLRIQMDLPDYLSYTKLPPLCEQQFLTLNCPQEDISGTSVEKNSTSTHRPTTIRTTNESEHFHPTNIRFPENLRLTSMPTTCQEHVLRITCPIADPLGNNEEELFSLELDMEDINSRIEKKSIFINVTLITNSFNINPPSEIVELKLKTEADISISGESGQQSYSYQGRKFLEFEQTYQIIKYGFSPVSTVIFDILVPYQMKTSFGLVNLTSFNQTEGSIGSHSIAILSYILDKEKKNTEIMDEMENDVSNIELLDKKIYYINCSMSEVICASISGKTGPFDSQKKTAVIRLSMIFDAESIAGLVGKNTVIQFSTVGMVRILEPPNLVQSGDRADIVSVSSIFVSETDANIIDLWIIIASAVSGLLLLLLITFILTKAGFFKRSTREELEQLKAQNGMADNEEKSKDVDFSENSE